MIENLFRSEKIRVENGEETRAVTVYTQRGEQDQGEGAVDLLLRWTDWNGYDPDKGYPVMQELHTDVRKGDENT